MQTPPSKSRILVYVVPAALGPLIPAATAFGSGNMKVGFWAVIALLAGMAISGLAAYKAIVFPGE